jgi:hypothetical protein
MPANRLALAALAAVCSILPSGCNIVAPVGYIVHGPEKTPALYTIPKDATVVVFVDDRQSFLPRRTLRQIIAESATKRLLESGSLTKMVEPRAALAASAGDQPGQLTEIVTIGKAAQADIVIYATVDAFSLTPDGQTFAPFAKVRVKVVEAANAQGRLWPDDLRGHSLLVSQGEAPKDLPRSPAALVAAENSLGDEIGRSVAEMFYSHERHRKISDR